MLLDLEIPHIPWRLVITTVLIFFPLHIFLRISSQASIPKELPWVGPARDGRRLSRAWATLMSFGKTRELSEEGYNKVSTSLCSISMMFSLCPILGPMLIIRVVTVLQERQDICSSPSFDWP